MLDAVDLELALRPSGADYIADARLTQPGSQADAVLASHIPVSLPYTGQPLS